MELVLKNEIAQFDALKKSCEEMAEMCRNLSVTDEHSLAFATQQLSKAYERIKQIDEIRTELKAPYFNAGKSIDSLAKQLSTPIEKEFEEGKKKVIAYNVQEQKKQQAEINRIQAIKTLISDYSAKALQEMDKCKNMDELTTIYNNYVKAFPSDDKFAEFLPDAITMRENLRSYASATKIKLSTPAEVDENLQDEIKEVIQEQVSEVGVQEVAEVVINSEQKGMKQNFTYELIDISKVPDEFLMVDDKKLKAWIKGNSDHLKDGMESNGIKFILEHKLTIR